MRLKADLPDLTVQDPIWRTKDGVDVAVSEMDDSHLLNTVRVLRGISPHGTTFSTTLARRRRWVDVMANEAYRRGLKLDPPTEEELSGKGYVHE